MSLSLFPPTIDIENPLYCPEVTAHQFLASARLLQATLDDSSRFLFVRKLCATVASSNSSAGSGSDSDFSRSSASLLLDSPKGLLADKLLRTRNPGRNAEASLGSISLHLQTTTHGNSKRNSDSLTTDSESQSSSDILLGLPTRPFKKKRSSSAAAASSFVLSAKADRLRFSSSTFNPASEWHATSDPIIPSDDGEGDASADCFWPDNDNIVNLDRDRIVHNGDARLGKSVKYKGATTIRKSLVGRIDAEPSKGTYLISCQKKKRTNPRIDDLDCVCRGTRLRRCGDTCQFGACDGPPGGVVAGCEAADWKSGSYRVIPGCCQLTRDQRCAAVQRFGISLRRITDSNFLRFRCMYAYIEQVISQRKS